MSSSRYPTYRSHYIPRTAAGRFAVVAFAVVFAFVQPPLVFLFANRVEPRVLGMPMLYWYLLGLYFLLIGVLIWALRRQV